MTEWRETTLGDVLKVRHGYAFKGKYFSDDGPDVLLTPKNFRAAGGLDTSPGRCKRYSGPVDSRFVLKADDIVLAMTDLKQDAPILGAAGRVPLSGRYLHNQRIGRVEVIDEATLSPAFVPWLLNSHAVRSQVRATATGATVRHTAPERIEAVVTMVPSTVVQRRIAAVLAAFDELIAINERRIELLEDLVRWLYREWFVRHVARDATRPATVADVAESVRGTISPLKHPQVDFEHFSIPAFDAGGLPVHEIGAAIKSNKTMLDGECVLLSKLNPRIPRVWLAVPTSDRPVASTEFLAWQGHSVSNAWLWATFQEDNFQRQMAGSAGGTSTSHQRVRPADVATYPIPRPNPDEMQMFDALATPALREATELRRANRVLARTRDLLLPRLVTGRLDVSDVDLGNLLPAEIAA